MPQLTPSAAKMKLMERAGITAEALDLCSQQAATAVDELVNGQWHPFLAQLVFAEAFFLTMSMCKMSPAQTREVVRDLFPVIEEAMRVHVEQNGGLGTLLSAEESSEIILPPSMH